MEIEIKKSGAKVFRYDEPMKQVDGGHEDTMLAPCGTKDCENSFETVYPEPGESMIEFCPDCMNARDREMELAEMEVY